MVPLTMFQKNIKFFLCKHRFKILGIAGKQKWPLIYCSTLPEVLRESLGSSSCSLDVSRELFWKNTYQKHFVSQFSTKFFHTQLLYLASYFLSRSKGMVYFDMQQQSALPPFLSSIGLYRYHILVLQLKFQSLVKRRN